MRTNCCACEDVVVALSKNTLRSLEQLLEHSKTGRFPIPFMAEVANCEVLMRAAASTRTTGSQLHPGRSKSPKPMKSDARQDKPIYLSWPTRGPYLVVRLSGLAEHELSVDSRIGHMARLETISTRTNAWRPLDSRDEIAS